MRYGPADIAAVHPPMVAGHVRATDSRTTALVDGGFGNPVGGRPGHSTRNTLSRPLAYRGLRPSHASAGFAFFVTREEAG